MRARVDLRLPVELVERLDARAEELGQTRTKFVERALERALGGDPAVPTSPAAISRALEQERASAPKPVPGVRPAREFVLDPRQARLNKAKGS